MSRIHPVQILGSEVKKHNRDGGAKLNYHNDNLLAQNAEELMHLLKMTTARRTPGRKPGSTDSKA